MACSRVTGFFGFSLVAFLAFAVPAAAQQAISGQVVDAANGQPIVGAQVSVVGGTSGSLTDARGNFSVAVPSGRHSIVVQFIGFETRSIGGVQAGESITVELTSTAVVLRGVNVTVSRGREQRTDLAPAHVITVDAETIERLGATTVVDYIRGEPGVDAIQTGIFQSNTVVRGFNNVFSGALLVLTDNRYARVPSINLNAYNMVAATPLDVERVEVVLGPAAALYGPNSANGVMHIITKSPIDNPGTSFSVAGGSRRLVQGVFRQSWANEDRNVGFKISGQYFRGDDFTYNDPVEGAAKANNPGDPLIGNRDYNAERYSIEARADFRPWDNEDDEIILTYGLNELISSVELTGIGAGQVKNWKYQFFQAQMRRGALFAQLFFNGSDSGDTYLLRTGQRIVDESTVLAAQLQYNLTLTSRIDAVVGYDYTKTNPDTKGTITGIYEDSDQTTEMGAYLHTTTRLSDRLNFVAALRVDDHEHLEDPVFSPRAALVFSPADGHSLRTTYNRAFGTPTTNNLFLDLVAGRIPLTPTVGYDVRTQGVPKSGFTFNNTCAGGVNNYCMYSPFAPGVQLPATGAALWDAVLVPLALTNATLLATLPLLGLTPESFAAIVGNPGPGDLSSVLLRFNSEDPSIPFLPDPGASPVARLKPTITNTYEVGYNGLIGGRLRIAASGYYTKINNFIGPLRVETPSVFLDGASVASFLVGRLTGVGIPLAFASQIAAGIAPIAASVPLGTVAPDQRTNSDLILTYRNFGDVDFVGADVGFEWHASSRTTLTGSYSHVSKECFDFDGDGTCGSSRDIALNAPSNKGSIGLMYDNKVVGAFIGGRMRFSDGFPMNSGVYVGQVESYQVLDLNMGYHVPGYSGFIVSLTLNNAFGNLHQEFIGAPEIGRIGMLKLQYEF